MSPYITLLCETYHHCYHITIYTIQAARKFPTMKNVKKLSVDLMDGKLESYAKLNTKIQIEVEVEDNLEYILVIMEQLLKI